MRALCILISDDNPSGSNLDQVPLDPTVAERDNSFREFRKLCANIAEENSHTGKTAIVANYLRKGASGGIVAHLSSVFMSSNYELAKIN